MPKAFTTCKFVDVTDVPIKILDANPKRKEFRVNEARRRIIWLH